MTLCYIICWYSFIYIELKEQRWWGLNIKKDIILIKLSTATGYFIKKEVEIRQIHSYNFTADKSIVLILKIFIQARKHLFYISMIQLKVEYQQSGFSSDIIEFMNYNFNQPKHICVVVRGLFCTNNYLRYLKNIHSNKL